MKKLLPLITLLAGFSQLTYAADLSTLNTLNQDEFRLLSEDLGSALSYKPVSPAEPLGITGFDIGIEASATDVSKSSTALSKATGNSEKVSTLVVPKLHIAKGLPAGFDVAAFAATVPTTNIKLVGAELKWAIIKGGIAHPAVAIRAAGTRLSGVDQLEFSTKSLDLSISKGFAILTPYIGVGQVWVDSKAIVTGVTLTQETFNQSKVFAGINMNLGLTNFALEGDSTGGANTYSFKMGFRW